MKPTKDHVDSAKKLAHYLAEAQYQIEFLYSRHKEEIPYSARKFYARVHKNLSNWIIDLEIQYDF